MYTYPAWLIQQENAAQAWFVERGTKPLPLELQQTLQHNKPTIDKQALQVELQRSQTWRHIISSSQINQHARGYLAEVVANAQLESIRQLLDGEECVREAFNNHPILFSGGCYIDRATGSVLLTRPTTGRTFLQMDNVRMWRPTMTPVVFEIKTGSPRQVYKSLMFDRDKHPVLSPQRIHNIHYFFYNFPPPHLVIIVLPENLEKLVKNRRIQSAQKNGVFFTSLAINGEELNQLAREMTCL
ncbi:hypothetical protein KC726_02950 [Candidatus Woesebacteria bacterium]|nr:hypothetical protein [Candidatus Woesebacteria bacterium]